MEIDIRSLLLLRHVAECGSFTLTGRYWNISQPTVSQMINRLEANTGIILLDRSGAKTTLTSDGKAFLERADEVCNHYLALIDRMGQMGRRLDRKVSFGMDRSWFSSELYASRNQLKLPVGVSPLFTPITGSGFDALESGRVDVVLASRFLHTGLPAGVQEALIRREKGITVAWKPGFLDMDRRQFSFPNILRTSVLIPDTTQVENFESTLMAWCQHAYGMLPANIETFPTEIEAASAALSGLGVLIAPGDVIPRLGHDGHRLEHIKTFEVLLPAALSVGVFCRSDENDKDVLQSAAQLGRLCIKLFPDNGV